MSNVIELPTSRLPSKRPFKPRSSWLRDRTRPRRNMQTYLFRSYGLIVQSDAAALAADVRDGYDFAVRRLEKIRATIVNFRANTKARLQTLEAAEVKLAAAVEAASRPEPATEKPPAVLGQIDEFQHLLDKVEPEYVNAFKMHVRSIMDEGAQ